MKQKFILLSLLTILAVSCGDSKQQLAKSESTEDSLKMIVAAKDSIINEAFLSIDQIASSLNQIAERENIVAKQTSSKDITTTTKDQIAQNISAISDLLEKNKLAVSRLNATAKKLKAANVKIDGLEKLVASLQRSVEDKDVQIAELTNQLVSMDIQIAVLNQSVIDLEQDVAQKTKQLNTVYYIVGNEKELMAEDIIDKKGGIGRTLVVGSDTDFSKFTEADRTKLDRIAIGGRKVKIVSSHPSSSYMLVMGSKSTVEELVITDKDAFWSSSKILIISHK